MPRFPRQESKPPKGGLRKLGIRRNVGAAWATRSPPSDCPPEGKKIVDQTSTYDTRCLIIPLSERRGWPGAYEETILNLAILPRLNRIVLGNRGPEYAPSADHFTLTYENPTFRVWARKVY